MIACRLASRFCSATFCRRAMATRRRSLRLAGETPELNANDTSASSLDNSHAETPAKKRKVQVKSNENAKQGQSGAAARKPSAAKRAVKQGLGTGIEEALWKQGYKLVAGVDEAGRGPLAGPVVAAACIVQPGVVIAGVMDSKKVNEADRERLFELLTTHPGITCGISTIEPAEIDRINILEAAMAAMEGAVAALPGPAPDAVLVDGNRVPKGLRAKHTECIVKGDSLCFSIAAASIIAKVTRDRIMAAADAKWPEYAFAQHKGYGTALHMAMVRKHGPCPIHRLTFRPLPEIVAALEDKLNNGETTRIDHFRFKPKQEP